MRLRSEILEEDAALSVDKLKKIGYEPPSSVLILGGSGFFGKWMVGILLNLIIKSSSNFSLCIQTSRKDEVINVWPNYSLEKYAIFFETVPTNQKFDLILDFRLPATGSSLQNQLRQSRDFYKNFFECLSLVNSSGTVVIPSSGAVYGDLKKTDIPLCEKTDIDSKLKLSIYGQTKFNLEEIGKKVSGLNSQIIMPRVFSAFGPLMRPDSPLIGNVTIKQAVEKGEIVLNSPFGVFRDFIYISDLIVQILAITQLDDQFININIGSGNVLEIDKFAQKVASYTGAVYKYQNKESQKDRYFPCLHSLEKAMLSLPLFSEIDFDSRLKRTIEFYRDSHD